LDYVIKDKQRLILIKTFLKEEIIMRIVKKISSVLTATVMLMSCSSVVANASSWIEETVNPEYKTTDTVIEEIVEDYAQGYYYIIDEFDDGSEEYYILGDVLAKTESRWFISTEFYNKYLKDGKQEAESGDLLYINVGTMKELAVVYVNEETGEEIELGGSIDEDCFKYTADDDDTVVEYNPVIYNYGYVEAVMKDKNFNEMITKSYDLYIADLKNAGIEKEVVNYGTYTVTSTDEEPKANEDVILGDVTGDGKIDSRDAVVILKDFASTILGNKSTLELNKADMNSDGKINSSDAVEVLKTYANSLISK
jgi:hypothetical protein